MKSIIFYFLTISFLVLFSCAKDKKPCTTCESPKTDLLKTTLLSDGINIEFSLNRYIADRGECTFHIGDATISKNDFDKLLLEYVDNNLNTKNLYSIVFYLDSPLKDGTTLDKSQIKGYTIFLAQSESILISKTFKFFHGEFSNVEIYNLQVNSVSSTLLNNILKKELFSNCNNTSYLVFYEPNSNKKFIRKDNVQSYNYIDDNPKMTLSRHPDCQEPCSEMDFGSPCYNDGLGWKCSTGVPGNEACDHENLQNYYDQFDMNHVNVSQINYDLAFDTNFIYDFRDNFLNNSNFGMKYIYYYYWLSDKIDNSQITPSLIDNTTNTLAKFGFEVMIPLLSPSTSDDNEKMSSELISQLDILLSTYKAIIDTPESDVVIDDISLDLQNVTDHTIGEIKLLFN